jgi:beta-lactamase superfamily II metal-dependent hydrolase
MNEFNIYNIGEGLGDCFFIEIKDNDKECIIMVDGRNSNIKDISGEIEKFDKIDYLVVTHIDADHIAGLLKIIENKKEKFENTIIIYNYVIKKEVNYEHARKFEKIIKNYNVISSCENNYRGVESDWLKILSYKDRCELDSQSIQKNCPCMTLIYPDKNGIKEVQEDYVSKQNKKEIQPKSELVNKNSIAFIIEYNDKTVIFTGDGEFDILSKRLNGLKNFENKKIDLIKMCHHGANANNKGLDEFAKKHECNKFIVTGEKKWKKIHPGEEVLNSLNAINSLNSIDVYTKIHMEEYVNNNKINFIKKKKIEMI